MDASLLDEWIDRRETAVDHITVSLAQRLTATLDRDDPVPRMGARLPTGWHGVLFPRAIRRSHNHGALTPGAETRTAPRCTQIIE